jgi:hypothetical protein
MHHMFLGINIFSRYYNLNVELIKSIKAISKLLTFYAAIVSLFMQQLYQSEKLLHKTQASLHCKPWNFQERFILANSG